MTWPLLPFQSHLILVFFLLLLSTHLDHFPVSSTWQSPFHNKARNSSCSFCLKCCNPKPIKLTLCVTKCPSFFRSQFKLHLDKDFSNHPIYSSLPQGLVTLFISSLVFITICNYLTFVFIYLFSCLPASVNPASCLFCLLVYLQCLEHRHSIGALWDEWTE